MANTVKADFYRLFHSKGFYITQVALLLLVVMDVLTESKMVAFSININGSAGSAPEAAEVVWTGANALVQSSQGLSTLMYLILPLFVITIGYDLTRKTYKNLLTSGVSRIQFFVSKYLVFLFMCLMQFVIYYGVTFVVASSLHGMGTVDGELVIRFLRTFGVQFICMQGVFIFAVIVMNLFCSNVAAVLTVFMFPILLAAVSTLTVNVLKVKQMDWIKYLNFQGNMDAAWSNGFPQGYWVHVCLVSLGVIVGGGLLSYFVFRKKDF